MSFTTPIFLYLFFPIAVCSFCLVGMLTKRGVFSKLFQKIRAKELALIGISLCFYAWANVANECASACTLLWCILLADGLKEQKETVLQYVL